MGETSAHLGVNLGLAAVVAGVAAAALAALGAPWPVWAGFVAFVALWLWAMLGLSDRASRLWMAKTLRDLTYTQIYTTLTRRLLMRIWGRLGDPVADDAGLIPLARAALTWRLFGVSAAMASMLLVVPLALHWAVAEGNEGAGALGSVILPSAPPGTPASPGVALVVIALAAGFLAASCAVTLALVRQGLRAGRPLLWGLLDLALACLLFLALGCTLVVAIHALNQLAGVPLVDLPALLAGVREHPGEYVWLYLMLFSTILPTALHGLLSLFGLQGIWPGRLRRPVAAWVARATDSPLMAVRAALALTVIWTVPLLLLGVALWAFWALAGNAVIWALGHYFDALLRLAAIPAGAI